MIMKNIVSYILLDKIQPLPINEVEELLKIVTRKFNLDEYHEGDIMKGYRRYGLYALITDIPSSSNPTHEIVAWLEKNKVYATVVSGSLLLDLYYDIKRDYEKNKPIKISFANKITEISFKKEPETKIA